MAQVFIPYAVIQPTQICNFDCTYCYLPLSDRQTKGFMQPGVAEAVARGLANSACPTTLNWHASEPMSVGTKRFIEMLRPFEELRRNRRLTHAMQTNASLVDDRWCDLIEEYGVRIGTSLDGPREANAHRVDKRGRETFDATMRGIETLKRRGIPFTVLAVANTASMRDPRAFYEFFANLGCTTLGINVEEQEGHNAGAPELAKETVQQFWRGLWEAWMDNRTLRIREFSKALKWIQRNPESRPLNPDTYSYWPTITVKGHVFLLSPEFAAAKPADRLKFVAGSVLTEPLDEIVARAKDVWYVREYFRGAERCRESCSYYTYCRGGMASNKFYETGMIDVTETNDCRYGQQAVINAMFEVFG